MKRPLEGMDIAEAATLSLARVCLAQAEADGESKSGTRLELATTAVFSAFSIYCELREVVDATERADALRSALASDRTGPAYEWFLASDCGLVETPPMPWKDRDRMNAALRTGWYLSAVHLLDRLIWAGTADGASPAATSQVGLGALKICSTFEETSLRSLVIHWQVRNLPTLLSPGSNRGESEVASLRHLLRGLTAVAEERP